MRFTLVDRGSFDWTNRKTCHFFIVACGSCAKRSFHLSYKEVVEAASEIQPRLKAVDLDDAIFTSIPSSFFTVDERVPALLRELITEAQGCLKMNFLTGASAATRKAIYELTVLQGVGEGSYDDRMRAMKARYPKADESLFDTLGHIQDMTSDKVHEQSWEKWDSPKLRFVLETLRAVLYDIYVDPAVRADRANKIQQLQQQVTESAKKTTRPGRPPTDAP